MPENAHLPELVGRYVADYWDEGSDCFIL